MEDPGFEAGDSGDVRRGERITRESGSDDHKIKNVDTFLSSLKLKECLLFNCRLNLFANFASFYKTVILLSYGAGSLYINKQFHDITIYAISRLLLSDIEVRFTKGHYVRLMTHVIGWVMSIMCGPMAIGIILSSFCCNLFL